MALRALMMTMIVAAAVSSAFAVDYIVGDNRGWNTGIGYAAWAEGRDFHVGDSITFMYTREEHNVIKVNATEFEHCTYSSATEKNLTSGFDAVPLTDAGKQWFISGVDTDCVEGMKLAVTVSVAEGPAPAPMPGASAPPPAASAASVVSPAMKSCVWLLAAMAPYIYRVVMA